jgi:hypothetical protein
MCAAAGRANARRPLATERWTRAEAYDDRNNPTQKLAVTRLRRRSQPYGERNGFRVFDAFSPAYHFGRAYHDYRGSFLVFLRELEATLGTKVDQSKIPCEAVVEAWLADLTVNEAAAWLQKSHGGMQ